MSPNSRARRSGLAGPALGPTMLSRVLLVLAIASVVLGVVVLIWPTQTVKVVAVLFGLYLLVSGVIQLALGFGALFAGGLRAMLIISGLLSVVLGLLCVGGGSRSVTVLAIWIGIGWLVRGIAELAGGVATSEMTGRGWVVFFGILDIVVGIVLIAAPVTTITALAVLAGIVLIALGLIGALAATRVGRASSDLDATWQARRAGRSARLP